MSHKSNDTSAALRTLKQLNIKRIIIDRYTDTLIIVVRCIHTHKYNIHFKMLVSKRIYNNTCRVFMVDVVKRAHSSEDVI